MSSGSQQSSSAAAAGDKSMKNIRIFNKILQEQQSSSSRWHSGYNEALAEIQAGKKRTHWMWYVFPAQAHLRSGTQRPDLLLPDLDSFGEYLAYKHDEHGAVLAARLVEITKETTTHLRRGVALADIYGPTDAAKFFETTTLFAVASALREDVPRETFQVFYDALASIADEKQRNRAQSSISSNVSSSNGNSSSSIDSDNDNGGGGGRRVVMFESRTAQYLAEHEDEALFGKYGSLTDADCLLRHKEKAAAAAAAAQQPQAHDKKQLK